MSDTGDRILDSFDAMPNVFSQYTEVRLFKVDIETPRSNHGAEVDAVSCIAES
jgi:hypothetical protein